MTFTKQVMFAFGGAFVFALLAHAVGTQNSSTASATSYTNLKFSEVSCIQVNARVRLIADEIDRFTIRSRDYRTSLLEAARAGSITRLRVISHEARADMENLQNVVIEKAKIDIEDAVSNGCVSEAKAAPTRAAIEIMSVNVGNVLAAIDVFDAKFGG